MKIPLKIINGTCDLKKNEINKFEEKDRNFKNTRIGDARPKAAVVEGAAAEIKEP